MSKSLENEYKKYIQMETPDVWDRIEKDLVKSKKRAVRRWTAFGSLAAAALLVVVVLPLISGGSKSAETSVEMCAVDQSAGTMREETAEGELLITIEVTITEMNVAEGGVNWYTGITREGEGYTFTIPEDCMIMDESGQSTFIQEGGCYSIDLQEEAGKYRAVSISEIKD